MRKDKRNRNFRSLRIILVDAGLGWGKLKVSEIAILSGRPDLWV